ncbi:PorP/SprF family type IX secretion system membrane protein [Chitinophaga sp. sic0106]|uniref:PorP/SprF family type IX secretion system membrane protein n=1 Tax=Chitinophaga sp. sic0106 TaxID=2854785 RepID=UPI001C4836BA|nr:PorP/SprF family type IX secretion system membrane protein [Chitinophaga sp. sic0106]MBV7530273.1 PorP/SprF family type IX secretion system membrane protein [Chitinophaga sp. sic0106]
MKYFYQRIFVSLSFASLLLGSAAKIQGQSLSRTGALLDPSSTQYYQNQYLANPAMAGIDTGFHFNAAYRRQLDGIDGAPTTQFFSADGYIGNRIGGGINVMNDKAGLLNRTRIAATYAYHLPLSDRGNALHFGLSLGMNFQRIDYSKVNGDPNDPSVNAFNRRDDYFEADYGMAYTDRHWTIQASLPNIRSTFSNKDYVGADGGVVFFSGVSYKFRLDGVFSSLEPKACYRSIKGYDGIVDLGVNLGLLQQKLNVMGLYHTSGTYTVGAGFYLLDAVRLNIMYTKQSGGYKNYTDGGFEAGLTLDLFK